MAPDGGTRSTLAALRERPLPAWFEDAKLGIFIHWGLFSIPAFAARLDHISDAFSLHYEQGVVRTPYTEWYDNAIRVPGSPSAEFHAKTYGGRPYAEFRGPFAAGLERWRPDEWARLFRRAGAGYVVLVTKHHDGYCLWPSDVRNPMREGWTTGRDVVGELAAAVRAEGLRFGVYYSGGIDWSWNPRPVRTLAEFVGSAPRGGYPAYAEAQVRELVERYQPSVLWNDISWPTDLDTLVRLMRDYYRAVPEGVVNDRWMHRNLALRLMGLRPVQRLVDAFLSRATRRAAARGEESRGIVPPRPAHYDFRTPEYTTFDEITARKWEATRGMTASFGYNRNDREEDYETPEALLHSFVDTVSKNGNLLLNVGPRGEDAAIPEPQVRRLELLGEWLAANGGAIRGTRPWTRAAGETADGIPVRFTRGRDEQGRESLNAILLGTPANDELVLPDLAAEPETTVTRMADGRELAVRSGDTGLRISLPEPLPPAPAHAFRITPVPRG
jgi:alpha-L-fucosidase